MQYTNKYSSPLGEMLMAADDTGLTGLWFMGQKYFALYLDREHKEKDLPVFRDTKHWLDIYFSGKEPNFKLPLHFTGSPFQNEVWKILYSIPYGKTMTYGEIARIIALQRGLNKSYHPLKKIKLLKLEGAWQERFFVPKKSTAP